MPNWVSVIGKWFPAKEKVFIPNNTDDKEVGSIYEGPDRAAKAELDTAKVEYLGQDYHMNPDLIRQSRELGFKTVDEYLSTMYGYDPKKAKIDSEKKLVEDVVTHKPAKPKESPQITGGGVSTVRGSSSDMYGGFGEGGTERGVPKAASAQVK